MPDNDKAIYLARMMDTVARVRRARAQRQQPEQQQEKETNDGA